MRNRFFRILLAAVIVVSLSAALTVPACAAVRRIVDPDSPCLHNKAAAVTVFDESLGDLLDDMWDTLESRGPGAVGLSAPEIGVLKCACVVDLGNDRLELVNPAVIRSEGSSEQVEGCLSAPGIFVSISRPQKITVKYMDRSGQSHMITAEDFQARIILHEIDHLNAVTILDPKNGMATVLSEGSLLVIIGCSCLAAGLAVGIVIGKRAGKANGERSSEA